jgi:hypothetical protein
MKKLLLALRLWLVCGGLAHAQPFGLSGQYQDLCCSGTMGNYSTGNAACQFPMQYGGRFIKMTIQNVSLSGGSCTTAPTLQATDGASTVGSTQLASASAQAVGTVTTVNYTPANTFAAGDIIGVEVSTTGGTRVAPIFVACLQVQSI